MDNKTRRVTANLPADLLEDALEATGQGITETLAEGIAADPPHACVPQGHGAEGQVAPARRPGELA
jgi:hypothetical protein